MEILSAREVNARVHGIESDPPTDKWINKDRHNVADVVECDVHFRTSVT
jgi:hypothetical protein